jgi:hypothetical protein
LAYILLLIRSLFNRHLPERNGMASLRNAAALIMIVSVLVTWNTPCLAAENPFRETFVSAFYGGLAGALVGTALLAFTNKPSDHIDYVAFGAAGGVLAGAAYGVASSPRALAEYENGKVRFAVPTIVPELREKASSGQTSLAFNAQLLKGTF